MEGIERSRFDTIIVLCFERGPTGRRLVPVGRTAVFPVFSGGRNPDGTDGGNDIGTNCANCPSIQHAMRTQGQQISQMSDLPRACEWREWHILKAVPQTNLRNQRT